MRPGALSGGSAGGPLRNKPLCLTVGAAMLVLVWATTLRGAGGIGGSIGSIGLISVMAPTTSAPTPAPTAPTPAPTPAPPTAAPTPLPTARPTMPHVGWPRRQTPLPSLPRFGWPLRQSPDDDTQLTWSRTDDGLPALAGMCRCMMSSKRANNATSSAGLLPPPPLSLPCAGEYKSEGTFRISRQNATLRCAPGANNNCSLTPFDERFLLRLLEATAGTVLVIVGDSISHQIWQARLSSSAASVAGAMRALRRAHAADDARAR
jgi:hypothetical protein